MYTVADLMTRDVVTLEEHVDVGLPESILAIARLRQVPVLSHGKLVGIIAQRDLLRALAGTVGAPRRLAARDVMETQLRTVHPHTPLRKAAEVLLRQRLGCVAVVEEDGTFVGLVTETDFVRFSLEVVTDLDRAADGLLFDERHAGDEGEGASAH